MKGFTDALRIELWARNLLDENAWVAGTRLTDFSIPGDFSFRGQGIFDFGENLREYGSNIGAVAATVASDAYGESYGGFNRRLIHAQA